MTNSTSSINFRFDRLPVLERFSATPQATLPRLGLLRRVDTKFILPFPLLATIVERLAADYTLVGAEGVPLVTYRTLYFDSPDLIHYHAHRRGFRLRQKVRIRHYIDRLLTFLEIKMKVSDTITVKERLQKSFGDSDLSYADRSFVRSHLPSSMTLVPQLWTQYTRFTLAGKTTEERVTCDIDLGFDRAARSVEMRGAAIVEVKQARYNRGTPVMKALHSAGVRPVSFSKYAVGMATLNPVLPHNLLLPSIQSLRRCVHV